VFVRGERLADLSRHAPFTRGSDTLGDRRKFLLAWEGEDLHFCRLRLVPVAQDGGDSAQSSGLDDAAYGS
jgi:hypothetical protein